ncbi:MAG: murein biosynthesis integral membrane protein MurJ [Gammaproteobacteria bacterium]|nr:MAG: murein biosynthesis integral membrane protein MurJ [Gammaproteobacteria bacterium]
MDNARSLTAINLGICVSDSAPLNVQPPKRNLLRSSAITGSMTMMSRVTGLVRDQLQAYYLGAGSDADAFNAAFRIPNFFRRLFSEGAFSQAFIPVLSEYRAKGSQDALKNLIDRVAGCLGSTLIVVTILGVIGAPVLGAAFASGFMSDPEKFDLYTSLIRIMFPYLMLISLSGFMGAILNSYDRFALSAFTPVLLNIVSIFAMLVVAPMIGSVPFALAWSVLLAGVLSIAFQAPHLKRMHLLPSPTIDWKDPGVRRILALMAPALFGVSISQINTLVDSIAASWLPEGSITWLYYSDRLVELPLGIFAVAIGTVIMPSLSRLHATESTEDFSKTLDWAIRMIIMIALPATLALVILAQPVIFTLFQHGRFDEHAAIMSSYSLQAYVLGLLAFMLIKVLAPGYFARQDIKTPVRVGMIAIACGITLKAIIVYPFHNLWQIGHVGLAISTAFAAYVNVGLLYLGLRNRQVYVPSAGWLKTWLRYGLANAVMVIVLLIGLYFLNGWAVWGVLERAISLLGLCVAGGVSYILGLGLAGFRPKDFRAPH